MMTTATAPMTQQPTAPTTSPEPLSGRTHIGLIAALLFSGSIFGFFFAWVCSTMWGLDAADPRVAIEAMQAMNASVRNAVFFPAFFLTPLVIAFAAMQLRRSGRRRSATRFFSAAGLYLIGGLVLTMSINVPMNEDLAQVVVPATIEDAAVIWQDYSGRWQVANIARTVVSGVSLALVGAGLISLDRS